MNTITFFLARRTLLASAYQKGISTMTFICFAGIFIGTFSLALITAILHGYEMVVHEKMQGIHAQIIIRSNGRPLNAEALAHVFTHEFPEITSFAESSMRHVLLKAENSDEDEAPSVAMITGINPLQEQKTTLLHKKITHSYADTNNLSQLLIDNQIIIGKQIATANNLEVGDSLELLFAQDQHARGRKVTFDSKNAVVGGIFDTGIDEFDSGAIFCSLSYLEKLFPDVAIEQINLKLHAHANEAAIVEKLRNRLGLQVYSWKDLYPALVSALKLEKYVTFFILALITLVACMNIISLLFMQITQKRPDIAILKALGMNDSSISMIFFIMGMMISSLASLCGLICACIASWFLQRYPFIQLPDVYYVTHLPVRMEWQIIIAVFVVVIFFSFLATWFPAQRIRTINVSRVLRFEG